MSETDARKKNFFKTILPVEELENLKNLSNPDIAKKLNVSIYMVKKSLAHHGIYKGKVYRKQCPSCSSEFFVFISNTKYCSNYCKHQHQDIWNKGLNKDNNDIIKKSSTRMMGNKLSKLVNIHKKNKTPILLPNLGINIYYDSNSNLEKTWLLQLDNVCGVTKVSNCDFSIPYVDSHNHNRDYYPDFIVDFETGLKWIVEIKGEISENDLYKIQQAREWCSENGYYYKLITTGMVHRSDWAFVFAEPKSIFKPSVETIFMNHAVCWANMSISRRMNVGCVIVSIDNKEIMGFGYNGDEQGGSNIAPSLLPGQEQFIHAEENALLKVKNQKPARMFITHLPCISCAKRIINSEYIKEVYYINSYRDLSGVGALIASGIRTYHYQLVDFLGKKYSDEECMEKLKPNYQD